jgi:hypothetical protein
MSRLDDNTKETVTISNFNINLYKKTYKKDDTELSVKEIKSNINEYETKRFKFDNQ